MSIGKSLNFDFEKPYNVLRKTLHPCKEKTDSHNTGEARLLCTQKRQPQGTQGRGCGWRWGLCWLCWSGITRGERLRPISAKSLD